MVESANIPGRPTSHVGTADVTVLVSTVASPAVDNSVDIR
jgi:hypothetical protein